MTPHPSRSVRVLHFPDWRGGNPYQALLSEALHLQGIDVSFWGYTGAFFPLTRGLRRFRPELLHLHWITDIAGLNDFRMTRSRTKQLIFRMDLALASRRLRGGVAWTVHNLQSHESHDVRADHSTHRFVARTAGRLFVHSPIARDLVMEAYGISAKRLVVIPHGNFVGTYPNNSSRPESRRRLAISDDRFVFLYVGGVRPYKGLERLLSEFERVSKPGKLLIVAGRAGNPEYGATIRRMVSSTDVMLLDRFIPDEELQFLFQASDAVVLPFRQILTSSSLILAMSFGRMVVAPRLGCVPDYAPADDNVLYDPAIPGSLAGALERACSRDTAACGQRNYETVLRFTWKDAAASTAGAYRELIAEK